MPSLLHPFVVHLPIAMALFSVPFVLLVLSGKLRWQAYILWSILYCLCTYAAMATGSVDRSIVEKKNVPAAALEEHEKSADFLLWGAVLNLVLAFAARGKYERVIQIACGLMCSALLLIAFRTAQLGGELVYRHGAAEAHQK